MMSNLPTAEELVVRAIEILQRGLPPGDLDDKGVVIELWGLLDSPAGNDIYFKAHPEQRQPHEVTEI